ncbi:hypothetical protein ACIBQ1_17305 [Nonomuraea sp. NPDC050153]|uniref:hypothetical protein n=1 Tax=Nonomuraea sp. NPDC050153 TaxID=3364359 RepID=UPI0037B4B4A3
MFRSAWAATAAACVVMPYALPILTLMSLVIADPGEQARAADQWNDGTPVGMQQADNKGWHPPMAAGAKPNQSLPLVPMAPSTTSSDLAYLRSELKRMAKEIGENSDWVGRGYSSFVQKVNEFDVQLEKLDNNRIACGESLKCSATAFHVIAVLCDVVAGLLTVMMGIVLAVRFVPGAQGWELAIIRWVMTLHKVLMGVFKKHWKLIMKITVILGLAGVGLNQFMQDLPFLKALPSQKPNLAEARVMWDASKADLAKDPTAPLDAGQAVPGVMPEFGF